MSSILFISKPHWKPHFGFLLRSNEIIKPGLGLILDWDSVWFIPSNLCTKYFCLLPKPMFSPHHFLARGRRSLTQMNQANTDRCERDRPEIFLQRILQFLSRVCKVAIFGSKFGISCFLSARLLYVSAAGIWWANHVQTSPLTHYCTIHANEERKNTRFQM